MPNQSAHIADLLKGGHQLRCFASIFVGALVMEGTILTLPIQNIELLFNITSGSETDIRPGFRVDIYTSGGDFKGRTRVLYTGAPTAHSVYIRETSPGSIDIQVGDIIRIYREVRLSDKLPSAALINPFAPDFQPASVNVSPPPLAHSGGAWAGWSRMLPAIMTGDSPLVDPDSVTAPTHLWDANGLSYSSGTSTSVSPQFTGTQGRYLPSHTVTDPDNGASITQYVPVMIHDKAHPPYKVIIEDLSTEETRGAAAKVRFLDNVLLANVPDGSLVILWKEEFIAGTRQSFGAASPGRSHILMVGYLRREQGTGDGSTGAETLTFDVMSSLARLDELMGYSKVMLNNASPDAWDKLKSLTIVRGLIQIPLFYSNSIESGDDWFIAPSVVDYPYPGLFADQPTPIQQERKLADGIDCRLVEDRRGRFEFQERAELAALSDRAALPVTLNLTSRMIKKWQYTREHWRPINRLQCNGFVAGYTSNPTVFSEWPGPSPAEGNQTSTIEGMVTSGQADMNARCGRRGAAADGIYVDANGVLQMALDLELTLRGVYDLFDFYDELIEVTVTANKRGIDFSGMQYRLVSSAVSFANGTAETVIRLRTCTHGVAGSTYTPPTPDQLPFPTTTLPPPQPIVPPAVLPGLIGRGTGRIATIAVNGIGLTPDFTTPAAAGGPTWTFTSKPWSGTLIDWIPNGFDPGKGWVVTDAEIGYLTLSSGAYTVKHSFGFTVANLSADASFAESSFFAVAFNDATSGTVCIHTTDNTTFTSTVVNSNTAATAGQPLGLYLSSKTPGKIVVGAFTGATTAVAYKSTDHGATWAALSPAFAASADGFAHIHAPWASNPSDNIFFYTGYILPLSSTTIHLYRQVGGSNVDITPTLSGVSYGPNIARACGETSVLNINRLLFVGQGSGTSSFAVLLTNNALASTPTYITVRGVGTAHRHCALAGDDPNTGFLWGIGSLELLTISGSAFTVDDRMGNLASLSPGNLIGLAGF